MIFLWGKETAWKSNFPQPISFADMLTLEEQHELARLDAHGIIEPSEEIDNLVQKLNYL